MIDQTLVQRQFNARKWTLMTRGWQQFTLIMVGGGAGLILLFVPLLLLGAAFSSDGRVLNLLLGLAFLALGGTMAAGCVVFSRRWAAERRRQEWLRAYGHRVVGTLVKSKRKGGGGDSSSVACMLFAAEVPGGPTVFGRLVDSKGLADGVSATIAYDPSDPAGGAIVESPDALRRGQLAGAVAAAY